jgi:hypothetical protein
MFGLVRVRALAVKMVVPFRGSFFCWRRIIFSIAARFQPLV